MANRLYSVNYFTLLSLQKNELPLTVQRLKYDRFVCVPSKPNNRASSKLGTPQGTVWRGLRQRLLYKPYRLQILQALLPNDKE